MQQAKGFTLIEIMIAVAIVGILTAVALPAYNDYTRKAKRSEAKSLLMQVAARQEQYYLNNKTYTETMTNLGFTVDADGKVDTENNNYKVYTLDAATAGCGIDVCYELRAVPQGSQANDACATLILKSDGTKDTTAAGVTCW